MRFRLTFITGMSLLFMVGGLYLAFGGEEGYVGKRFFLTMVGILGWAIGTTLQRWTNGWRMSRRPAQRDIAGGSASENVARIGT